MALEFACFDVVLAFAALFGLAAFFTLRCRVHSALSPLVSLCSVSLVLAAAGVAGVLRLAVWAVYLLCFVLGAAALRQKRQNRKALCTPGAVLFWTMSAAFAVYFALRQPLFTDFDEMSFWGTAAKLTHETGGLYTVAPVSWPWQATQSPCLITLGYFVQALGRYGDWKVYLAYDMLAFACFAALLGRVEWKQYRLAVPLAAVCWCVPYFFTTYNHTIFLSTVYLSAYGDIPSGLVLGGTVALWLALREGEGPRWPVLPVLAFSALIKSNTFVLALAAAGLVAADWLLTPGTTPWKQGLVRRIGFAAACFAAPLAAYRCWGQYTLALALKNAESGGMGETSPDVVTVAVNGIRMILGLPVGDYYEARRSQFYTACGDMLHQYLTRDGTLSMIGQGVVVTGLILALFFAAWLVAGQRGLRVRIGLFALFSTLCFLGYNLMLALSYGFIFKPFQAERLEDYNRYVYTYYIGWFLIALALVGLALRHAPRLDLLGHAGVLALAAVMLLRVNQMVLPQLSVLGFSDAEFADRQIQQSRAEAVAAVTDGARLFYVYQGDNGLHWFTATYDFYPQIVDYSGNGGGTFGLESLRPGEDTVEGYYFHPYTEAAFAALVESTGCEYLYLDKVDDLFRESYGGLFSDGLAAAEQGETLVYHVDSLGHYSPVEMEVP